MHTNDPRDLEQRAEEELKLAQKAKDARAVEAHYQLACRYLELLYPEQSEEAEADEGSDEPRRRRPESSRARH